MAIRGAWTLYWTAEGFSLYLHIQWNCRFWILSFPAKNDIKMSSKGTVSVDEKKHQEERLSKKHIQTLGYVQELMKENKRLAKLIDEYEQQKLHCDDLHAQNEAVSCLSQTDRTYNTSFSVFIIYNSGFITIASCYSIWYYDTDSIIKLWLWLSLITTLSLIKLNFTEFFKAEDRIKKLQQQYLDRADEINAELVRKHQVEIMVLIQEKLEAEKQLADRSREMSLEIERLQKVTRLAWF